MRNTQTNPLIRNPMFDDFLRDFAPGFFIKPLQAETAPATPAQIRVEVRESDENYVVQAEVPGVSKDDIQVSIDGNVVSLRAEIVQQEEQEGEKVLRTERQYGELARSFQLPAEIESDQAKAKYDQGVLTLTLPKKQSSNAQRVTIE